MQGTCIKGSEGVGCKVCPGGENFSCGIGYQDVRKCAICEDNYFYTFNECYECPGGGGAATDYAFTIGVEVFSVSVWFFLNTKVPQCSRHAHNKYDIIHGTGCRCF